MNPTIIIGVIVFTILFIAIVFIVEKPQTTRSILGNLAGCIAGGVFTGLFLGFMISLSLTPDTHIESQKYNLITLQDNNGMSGRLFLGTGGIFSGTEYAFYMEDSLGFYNLHTVPTFLSSITYTTDTPHVEVYRNVRSETKWNDYARRRVDENPKYIFYIPENSIVMNYNLDAK